MDRSSDSIHSQLCKMWQLTVVSSSWRTWSYSLIATQNIIAVTSSKQWIHFLRSDLCPPTSNNLKTNNTYYKFAQTIKCYMLVMYERSYINHKHKPIYCPWAIGNINSISHIICTWPCYALFCLWLIWCTCIYSYALGLLHWHWGRLPQCQWSNPEDIG